MEELRKTLHSFRHSKPRRVVKVSVPDHLNRRGRSCVSARGKNEHVLVSKKKFKHFDSQRPLVESRSVESLIVIQVDVRVEQFVFKETFGCGRKRETLFSISK